MKQSTEHQIDFIQFITQTSQQLAQQLQTNLHLRLKFPTQTSKYYTSQQQIHTILTAFQQKLQQTEQQPLKIINHLISSKFLVPLLKTLQHPNVDINISAVNCYYSLIIQMNQDIQQAQNNQKNQEELGQTGQAFAIFFRMCIWFVENRIIQGLYKIMSRIEQQKIQEYEACTKIFKIFQYFIELSNTVYQILIRDTNIIHFLANRIMPNFTVSHRVIDDNKFVASDILLSLLQTPQIQKHQSAVRQFYKCSGIEVIIETISAYQNKLPTQIDERQYLINLFDCLNVMLVSVKQTRKQFHHLKGCYLMISYICAKTQYAVAALKAISNSLDNQVDNQVSSVICDEIVNDGSLKYIFPILMMQGLKGKDDEEQQEINENVLRIMYYLIKNSEGVSRDRILYKLTQKRYEKLQRIFQLIIQIKGSSQNALKADVQPQQYIQLVKEQGVAMLQICVKIITTLWNTSSKTKQKILALLPLYSLKFQQLKAIIQRHYKYIDQGSQKNYLEKLLATVLRDMQQGIIKK